MCRVHVVHGDGACMHRYLHQSINQSINQSTIGSKQTTSNHARREKLKLISGLGSKQINAAAEQTHSILYFLDLLILLQSSCSSYDSAMLFSLLLENRIVFARLQN